MCRNNIRDNYVRYYRENNMGLYPRTYGEDGGKTEIPFSVGNTVYLKSGSSPKVVTGITQEGRVQVVWQDFYGDLQTEEFNFAVLTTTPTEVEYPQQSEFPGNYDDDCA